MNAPCLLKTYLLHLKHVLRPVALTGSAVVLFLVGCRQKMADQPRYEPYEASVFFTDSLSARPLVAGTVSRERRPADPTTTPYRSDAGVVAGGGARYEQGLTDTFPFRITRAVLERGQQAFDIYCSPCHGRLGDGQGMVVQRGLRAPPSFHTDRLRKAPAGHFFNVITNGFGAMYSYAARLTPEDRWAVVAYIRALQLSQHASQDDVPPDKRDELQGQPP